MNHSIRHFVIIYILFQTGALLTGNSPDTYNDTDSPASYAPANIPTAWNETKNVKWKTEIHEKAGLAPVLLGDQIWITTAAEMEKKCMLFVSVKNREDPA